jgi:hypothetical protein
LTVAQFQPASGTPGNVGLCLSGGGTRACCAGMGELRAFAYLQANGASLLSQVKALSTVSGGSWLGVPYMFMPPGGPSDAAYLGTYDADQGALTLGELAQLPSGNAGNPIRLRCGPASMQQPLAHESAASHRKASHELAIVRRSERRRRVPNRTHA